MSEPAAADRSWSRVLAWLGMCLPIFAWVSQVPVAAFVHDAPVLVYLLIAASQFFLMVAGPVLGMIAIIYRGHRGIEIIIPAVIGFVVSAGTFLLIFGMVVWTILSAK